MSSPHDVNPDPATRVSYDLAEVLTDMKSKMDKVAEVVEALRLEWVRDHNRLEERVAVIEAKPSPIENGPLRMSRIEDEVKDHEARLHMLETQQERRTGIGTFGRGVAIALGVVIAFGNLATAIILLATT